MLPHARAVGRRVVEEGVVNVPDHGANAHVPDGIAGWHTGGMSEYRVQFTVEARAAYDGLPGERRAQLDRAVRILSRDPFRKAATAQLGPDEHLRRRTWPPA